MAWGSEKESEGEIQQTCKETDSERKRKGWKERKGEERGIKWDGKSVQGDRISKKDRDRGTETVRR